jgi:transposase
MFVGVDSHKDSLAICAVDGNGGEIAGAEFPNSPVGHRKIVAWLGKKGAAECVGIEGAGQYGAGLVRALTAAGGFDVREVPTHFTARERRRGRQRGKSDAIDALAIARIVARERHLPPAVKPDHAMELGAISDYRDELVAERTATCNRLHADLVILHPGYTAHCRSLTTGRMLSVAARLLRGDSSAQANVARRRIARLRTLDGEILDITKTLRGLLEATGTQLLEIPGLGTVSASRIVAEVGDVRRFRNRDAFASANGTAPIPASSGRTVRYRLNRGGNRRLNRAIHIAALVQARIDPRAREYLERKRTSGKTNREGIRCLKRHLSDVIYRAMCTDIAPPIHSGSPISSST